MAKRGEKWYISVADSIDSIKIGAKMKVLTDLFLSTKEQNK